MNCPKCHSSKFVKNGHTHYGKQRFRCQHCGRQFVNNPSRQPISQDKRDLIDKLLKERLALAAMRFTLGLRPTRELLRFQSVGCKTMLIKNII
jgi:transposase-like protein